MTWEELCEHKSLRNLPFKIQTNRYGQVVMSPAKNNHGFMRGKLVTLLAQLLPSGEVSTELAIEAADGVKVADVAWVSVELYRRLKPMVNCDVAPEICAGIVSASNSVREMAEKREFYLDAGAMEVWLADPDGGWVEFHAAGGRIERSVLCPEFPPVVPL